jgi:hypothetical protein
MSADLMIWTGLFLSLLTVFVLSMFHITLDSFSKIQVSRFLEDRKKADRHKILKDFDDTRTAAAYLRVVVLVAFMTYLFIAFPRLRFWPLWLFLIAIGIHTLFFEALPRLINFRGKNAILKAFLPAAGLFRALGSPILLLTRNLGEREMGAGGSGSPLVRGRRPGAHDLPAERDGRRGLRRADAATAHRPSTGLRRRIQRSDGLDLCTRAGP